MGQSVDQFGKSLVSAGFFAADELKTFWSSLSTEQRPKDGAAFAALLIERGKLTKLQADWILAGRGGSLLMGDYLLLDEIGAGGMGQVYKARHRRMNRIVALKVMSSAAMKDEASVKRFQREVRAAARLEHPNIVTAYDSGEAGNVKYLVMQFVDGGDLSSLVKNAGPLPLEQAIDYTLQAARGLAFAHGEGVTHRDIKPANLLLDKKGIVKILDMGLARIEDSSDGLTATEQVMGTVDYMSPEQAAETKNADGRSDIYALGCTLWFLLTGKKLYDGDTMISRLMKHRDAPLPSLTKERDDATWPLEQALHKMLAKRPQDRFQTMEEVVAALEPYGGGGAKSGSSSSLSAGPQNAELAAFLQNAGPGTKTDFATKSRTAANVDTTAALENSSTKTNPKLPAATAAGKKSPATKLIAGGLVGAVIVIGGIVALLPKAESDLAQKTTAIAETAGASTQVFPPATNSGFQTSTELSPSKRLESADYAWTVPENLGPQVNDETNNRFPALSADELCLVAGVGTPTGGSDLREFHRANINSPWGEPIPLKDCDYETDPALSSDGLTLYFASSGWKKTGFLGGYDIWMRRRANRDTAWGPPQNKGAPINTPSDDGGPALSPDGLTFAWHSNRPGGSGGDDIWLCSRATPTSPWSSAVNAGPSINSTGADRNPRFLGTDGTLLFERGGELYMTFRSATGVTGALVLGGQLQKYYAPWPSPDGARLYFHGNLQGGFGYDDVWVSRRVLKSQLSVLAGTPFPRIDPATGKPAEVVYADDLTELSFEGGKPLAKLGKYTSSIDLKWHGGKPAHSLFTHPHAETKRAQVVYHLGGSCEMFAAAVGMTAKPVTPLVFRVVGDGKTLWESPPQAEPDVGLDCSVSVRGVNELKLEVLCPGIYDFAYAVWIDPRLTPAGVTAVPAPPRSVAAPPKPGGPSTPWPFDPQDGRKYAWSAPENLGPEVNTPNGEILWSVSEDERKIEFVNRSKRVLNSRRADARAAFPPPAAASFSADGDGTVSADDLSLAFTKRGEGLSEIWMSRRSAISDAFPAAQRAEEPVNVAHGTTHPVLSGDGLTLLATSTRPGSQSGDIWMFTRKTTDGPFTTVERLPQPVNTPDWDMPYHISNDRRFVIASQQKGTPQRLVREARYFTRTTESEPFAAGIPLGIPLGEALTSDTNGGYRLADQGRSIYFHSSALPGFGNGDIWVSRRVPVGEDRPATSPATSGGKLVDLLPLVDVARDALSGDWSLGTDGLVVRRRDPAQDDTSGSPRLQLPYAPPEEYDFEIEFAPEESDGQVRQTLFAGGRAFNWTMDVGLSVGRKAGFELYDGSTVTNRKEASTLKPQLFVAGRKHRSRLEVRHGEVKAYLDDQLLVGWKGDFQHFDLDPKWRLRDAGRLAVGAYNRSVTFHKISVREVTGTGKIAAVAK